MSSSDLYAVAADTLTHLARTLAELTAHPGLLPQPIADEVHELLVRMEIVIETGLAERDRMVHRALHGDDPVPSHAAVVAAIRQRDPDGAAAAMRELLHKAMRDLEKSRETRS